MINLLVSLASEARISALLRKVEGDYRRKTQQMIKCKQLLVQDCFEIVDVYKSQVQHYLTDMMQVTVLALRVSEKDQLPNRAAKDQIAKPSKADVGMNQN